MYADYLLVGDLDPVEAVCSGRGPGCGHRGYVLFNRLDQFVVLRKLFGVRQDVGLGIGKK
jgi:hypothetical protein